MEKNYKRTSKEAFDFMSEVKDVITERCELFTDDATGKPALLALAKEAGLYTDSLCENVVAKITDYVKNYNGPMVDYYGLSEFIYMRWDNFTEDEKEYVMEDEHAVKSNIRDYLKKDNIIVKEMLIDENGIVVYVEWR